MKLVSATANPNKYKEMKEILSGKIDLLPRPDEIPEIVEDASDLNGNALLKAQGIMKATGLPAIADLSLIHISEPTRLLSIAFALVCL